MTTPIERGAEAIAGEYDRRGHLKPGTWWSAPHRRADLRMEARAVFESIDHEELRVVVGHIWNPTFLAKGITDYLTGDQS